MKLSKIISEIKLVGSKIKVKRIIGNKYVVGFENNGNSYEGTIQLNGTTMRWFYSPYSMNQEDKNKHISLKQYFDARKIPYTISKMGFIFTDPINFEITESISEIKLVGTPKNNKELLNYLKLNQNELFKELNVENWDNHVWEYTFDDLVGLMVSDDYDEDDEYEEDFREEDFFNNYYFSLIRDVDNLGADLSEMKFKNITLYYNTY